MTITNSLHSESAVTHVPTEEGTALSRSQDDSCRVHALSPHPCTTVTRGSRWGPLYCQKPLENLLFLRPATRLFADDSTQPRSAHLDCQPSPPARGPTSLAGSGSPGLHIHSCSLTPDLYFHPQVVQSVLPRPPWHQETRTSLICSEAPSHLTTPVLAGVLAALLGTHRPGWGGLRGQCPHASLAGSCGFFSPQGLRQCYRLSVQKHSANRKEGLQLRFMPFTRSGLAVNTDIFTY